MKKIKQMNWAERSIILCGFIIFGSGIPTSISTGDPVDLLFPFVVLFPLVPLVLLIWSRKWAGIYTVGYVLVYAVLSFNGRYYDYIGGGGGSPPIFYPLGMVNNRPGKTGRIKTEYPSQFGWMFWPLLLIDQSFIHTEAKLDKHLKPSR